jgi:hypothetical protein
VQPANRNFQPIYDRVKNRKVLEELQQFLAPLRLPRKLTVKIDQCGALSRPYKPQEPVTICYELIDQIEKVAAKGDPKMRQTMIAGAFIQVVVYQVAHAMFDILQVPVWGRAGDAADRLAALVMLQFGEDLALRTIRGSTAFFLASKKTWTGSAFADADSPEEQRYYNYLCIAFGGAPISFDFLVSGNEPVLPLPRARRCYWEYQQGRMAFFLHPSQEFEIPAGVQPGAAVQAARAVERIPFAPAPAPQVLDGDHRVRLCECSIPALEVADRALLRIRRGARTRRAQAGAAVRIQFRRSRRRWTRRGPAS